MKRESPSRARVKGIELPRTATKQQRRYAFCLSRLLRAAKPAQHSIPFRMYYTAHMDDRST